MKVNPQQLLEDGFVILKQVIPPERLQELRAGFEVLVERQKVIWADQAGPDDPPGGDWETHPQPRLVFNNLGDAETAHTVEFCLHEAESGRILTKESFRDPSFISCFPRHWYLTVEKGAMETAEDERVRLRE